MLTTAPLKSLANLESIVLLKSLVQSSIGPDGHIKILCNGSGGQPQLTSCSVRILNVTRISNPALRVLTQAAVSHLKCHGNDGLYLMSMALEMLDGSLRLVPEVPQCNLARLNQVLAGATRHHLQHECGLRVRVGFDNLYVPLALANSILNSKPACGLTEDERGHLARLLTKAFLDGVPTEDRPRFATLHYVSQQNQSPDNTSLHPGVLVPVVEGRPFDVAAVSGRRLCALFRVSLSGDVGTELVDNTATTFLMFDQVDVVSACVSRILQLCDELLAMEVDVVACQKVIHPRAKIHLENHGVLVLDRLGILTFAALLELTGCCAIESFVSKTDRSNFGTVDRISVNLVGKESYYHFQINNNPVNTLVLCNYLEESLEELKVVCRQAVGALRSLVHFPYVYPGGGCLESHLAAYARHWANKNRSELLKIVNNAGQVDLSVANFSKCLERVGTSLSKHPGHPHKDDVVHHLWQLSEESPQKAVIATKCVCGLMKDSDSKMGSGVWQAISKGMSTSTTTSTCAAAWKEWSVPDDWFDRLVTVDAASSKLAAFQTALETVVTLLSVDTIVKK